MLLRRRALRVQPSIFCESSKEFRTRNQVARPGFLKRALSLRLRDRLNPALRIHSSNRTVSTVSADDAVFRGISLPHRSSRLARFSSEIARCIHGRWHRIGKGGARSGNRGAVHRTVRGISIYAVRDASTVHRPRCVSISACSHQSKRSNRSRHPDHKEGTTLTRPDCDIR